MSDAFLNACPHYQAAKSKGVRTVPLYVPRPSVFLRLIPSFAFVAIVVGMVCAVLWSVG